MHRKYPPKRQPKRRGTIGGSFGKEVTGGKRGIRTLGTGKPVRRISNPVHSTTLPSFLTVDRAEILELQGLEGAASSTGAGFLAMAGDTTLALRGAKVKITSAAPPDSGLPS